MAQVGGITVQADAAVVVANRVSELEQRVRELKHLLGHEIMEVGPLKEAPNAEWRVKPFLAVTAPVRGAFRRRS